MKKYLSIIITLALILSLALPTQIASAATVKISQKTATIIKGDYLYLKVKGTTKKITWSSSNKYVATVSSKGKVTTVGKGKSTIIAKVGSKKYTCKITVVPNTNPNYKTDMDLENDISERNAIDGLTSSGDEIPEGTIKTPKSNSGKRNLDGMEYSGADGYEYEYESDYKPSESTSIPEWIGDYQLSTYGLSSYLLIDSIYLSYKYGNNYTITRLTEGSIEEEVVYEGRYETYTIRYKYSKELLLNTEDLKKAGIIK